LMVSLSFLTPSFVILVQDFELFLAVLWHFTYVTKLVSKIRRPEVVFRELHSSIRDQNWNMLNTKCWWVACHFCLQIRNLNIILQKLIQ
jgi:hypothetical protein